MTAFLREVAEPGWLVLLWRAEKERNVRSGPGGEFRKGLLQTSLVFGPGGGTDPGGPRFFLVIPSVFCARVSFRRWSIPFPIRPPPMAALERVTVLFSPSPECYKNSCSSRLLSQCQTKGHRKVIFSGSRADPKSEDGSLDSWSPVCQDF